MMRVPLLVCASLLCSWGGASAHRAPAARVTVVQAERDAVAVMVTWKAPVGPAGDALMAKALYGQSDPKGVRQALKQTLVIRALSGLDFQLDGARWQPEKTEIKVSEDPPGSGRKAVILLLTGSIDHRMHSLAVEEKQGVSGTSFFRIDRSGGRAKFQPLSPARSGVVLSWRGT